MMNAALANTPTPNLEPPSLESIDGEAPDVVSINKEECEPKRRVLWPIAVLVVAAAAGVWYVYPQIAASRNGESPAATGNGETRPKNGKATLGPAPVDAKSAAEANASTASVKTVLVKIKKRFDVLKLTGTLMADERSSVASNTSGIAAEVRIDRGSIVKKNDVLVQIDPTDAMNKLAEGQATLDELKARLGLDGDMTNFKPEDEPEVRLAKAAAELAAANLRRAKENIAKKVISKESYDQTETEYELASQRYRQSLFQIKQAFQVCRTAQIKLGILKKAVDDTTIRAPFDGWVAEKLVSVGEQISSGMQATKVVTLVRIDPLRLSLTVPQKDVGSIRLGQIVKFRVDSFPDREFEAKVKYVAPVVANDTRSMVVEAVVPNPSAELHPGLFATADLQLAKQQTGVFAPVDAVLKTGEVGRVFVVRDGVAHEQVVSLGDAADGEIEIRTGLTGKELLVANPESVRDGDAVRP
jgi:RND family efflux transporter MFP subunit